MIRKTELVVLRTQPMGDTSLLLHGFSRHFGRLGLIAKGVRSPKSRSRAALLQPAQVLQVLYYHKPNRDLHTLSEVSLLHHPTLRFANPSRSLYALLICEVFAGCYRVEDEHDAEESYAVLKQALVSLDDASATGFDTFVAFLLGLVLRLGFLPDCSEADPRFPLAYDLREGRFENPTFAISENPAERFLFQRITLPEDQATLLTLPKAHRRAFVKLMMQVLIQNVPNFSLPRSLEVFEEVFS